MTTQAGPIILGHRLSRESEDSGTSDLQRMVGKVTAILSRRRWLFVIPTLTGLLVALAVGLMLPRQYWVTASFERRNDDVVTKLVDENTPYSFASLRDSLAVDLKGYGTVVAAVEELGLTRDFPRDADGNLTREGQMAKRALVDRLSAGMTVSVEKKSRFLDVIAIFYTGQEPEIAAKVINRLVDNYKVASRSRAREILNSSYKFFSREAEKQQKRVLALETELLRMTMAYPEAGPSEPGLIEQGLMNKREALEELAHRREEVQANIAARQEYLDELERERAGVPVPASRPATSRLSTVPNPKRVQLAARMEEIRAQIADAKAIRQVTDYHPDVVALRRKLENLEEEMLRQPEQVAKAALTAPHAGGSQRVDLWLAERRRVEMELKSFRNTLRDIERRVEKHEAEKARLEGAKASLFERRRVYTARQRELEKARADLVAWKGPAEQIDRILTAEAENHGIQFATHRAARYPGALSAPTLPGIYLLSIGIALGVGVTVVFLREIFDRSFRDPARVREKLGIPVLETVGEIHVGRPAGWFIRHRLLPVTASVQVVAILGMGLLVYLRLKEAVLYDRLVAQLSSSWPG